jgi:polyhydroxyalkanoate synthase
MARTEFRHGSHAPDLMDVPLKLWLARLAHGISPTSVAMAHFDWFGHLMASPAKQAELVASAARNYWLWMGYAPWCWHAGASTCVEPMPQDRRFSPREWQLPPFSALAQAFLLQEQWWVEATQGVRGVSVHHEDVASFTVRQWLDMWSPSNFVATNPQVLRETLATAGGNLANGWTNWWHDALVVLADGKPRGIERFVPGQGVALTPGKVVFRNALIELIQYEAATPRVQTEPVLIIPSWIMKYYILDLTPDDSLVKYLVQKGHTVFMVSWKNPSGDDRGLSMDDYLELGVLAALRAIEAIRPGAGIQAMGYCLGGTLLAIAAALLGGGQRRNPLKTVTLLAAQTDFQEPGELGLFIDESQITFVEDLMSEQGYLDGRQMAGAFQLINSKDLVWSKLVHEYLMGAQTPMTALRAWNADATRMPARMHSQYLRQLYLDNDLAQGHYRVAGKPVSLADVKVPLFVVATERDHVSPWTSVYKIGRLAGGPVSFALSSGGHNVGIVNPPAGPLASPQASYRFAEHGAGQTPVDPEDWLHESRPRKGSWWPCWHDWLTRHASGKIKPPRPVGLRVDGTVLEAPGSYVHLD